MDVEEIKKRKLQEMLNRINIPHRNEENIADPIKIADEYVKHIRANLDDKAYERLMNVRMINPELYVKAVYLLYQMKATGRLFKRMSDSELKSFLSSLLPKKREPRIIRK